MLSLSIPTPTHARVLVQPSGSGTPSGTLVVFHGYGQSAEEAMADALLMPGIDAWRVVAPQGLHRFYARDQRVVASWMTRQDRDEAIADNVTYVDRVLDEVCAADPPDLPLVFVGFSQGASMAYRAAALGRRAAAGLVALAGDIPPELKAPDRVPAARWPPTLIGGGTGDTWFTPEKAELDASWLGAMGASVQMCRFEGGHEWTPQFRDAFSLWISRL